MKKKLNIPKDFWKNFKDRKDFDAFFGELYQEGINQMDLLLYRYLYECKLSPGTNKKARIIDPGFL